MSVMIPNVEMLVLSRRLIIWVIAAVAVSTASAGLTPPNSPNAPLTVACQSDTSAACAFVDTFRARHEVPLFDSPIKQVDAGFMGRF